MRPAEKDGSLGALHQNGLGGWHTRTAEGLDEPEVV